ncbi:M50 family metallopeptidase [Frankia gtarii]|uniref:M50 family metallopeptidase n=1 Tax=Frankia gtarii TaxID=2950102 RepID=UPI0021C16B15|nr:M50 family metallopeptidase [Frankia gtarii]
MQGRVTAAAAVLDRKADAKLGVLAAVVDGAAAPRAVAVVTALLALLALLVSRWPEHLDTAVHEGGHAFAAFLAGRLVAGVWVEADGSGLTWSFGRRSGVGLFATRAAGYLFPSLVGVCSARLLTAGKVTAVLILGVLALAALLLVVRNGFGERVVLIVGASMVLTARYCPDWAQTWYAYLLTWVLLFSGPRSVLVLHRARRRGAVGSDADRLAESTHIPAVLWVLAFAAFSLWCALKGAALLLA